MTGPALPERSGRQVPWPRGVTFIELITLTIAILILAFIGIPRISPIVQQFRLKGASWQLAGDLRLARQRAVTTQRRFRICVDPTKCAIIPVPVGAYSVEVEQPPVGSLNWTSETGAAARLPPDVTVTATVTATFKANGMLDPSSGLGATFTLSNAIGTYEVRVASTGRVRVCQGTCSP
jgi:Tfp pilus assembly protein FimT